MAGKPIRLGKAASELNVGLPTLVEFLESKGVKIDSNPNTKLEPQHFDLLCTEFAADQSMKEQSKGASVREKRESLSLKDVREVEKSEPIPALDEEDEADINLDEIKRKLFTAPKPSPAVDPTPVAPEPKPEVEIPPVAEVVAPEIESNSNEMHVQVVGKIDLDAINQRTRPDKNKVLAPEPKIIPELKKVEEKPVVPVEKIVPEPADRKSVV